MKNLVQDVTAAATTVSSPVWAYYLAQINLVLTFISLALGIAFLLYRWRKGK